MLCGSADVVQPLTLTCPIQHLSEGVINPATFQYLPLLQAIDLMAVAAGSSTSEDERYLSLNLVLCLACVSADYWALPADDPQEVAAQAIRRRLSEIQELGEKNKAVVVSEERKMLDAVLELVVDSQRPAGP